MHDPLVSIITPVYNAERYVAATILSVCQQTYANWEMILVDDASTDMSKDIILDYSVREPRIKYIKLMSNMGVAAARNEAIQNALGTYIAFLDSDDIWDKTKLEKQIKFMKDHGAALGFTAYRKIDGSGNLLTKMVAVPEKLTYTELLKHNQIGCLTAMYDAEALGKVYFQKMGHEDYSYWLGITRKGVTAYGLNETLASYRVRGDSISGDKIKAASFTWNIYRKSEKMNILQCLYYFTHYAVRSLIKYLK